MRLVWETNLETDVHSLKIVSTSPKNNRITQKVMFAAKSRKKVEKARDKAKIFIASKTKTVVDTEEFAQALKSFDVEKMKRLFPCLYVTREIYDTEFGGYVSELKEGKDYIVFNLCTQEWYYVADISYEEVDDSCLILYTSQRIKLGKGFPF